ncbi:hypothetical protein BDZ97DRAFT_1767612, partial [Flammula alnicola]
MSQVSQNIPAISRSSANIQSDSFTAAATFVGTEYCGAWACSAAWKKRRILLYNNKAARSLFEHEKNWRLRRKLTASCNTTGGGGYESTNALRKLQTTPSPNTVCFKFRTDTNDPRMGGQVPDLLAMGTSFPPIFLATLLIYLLGLLSELSLLMDDPKRALYLGPPVLRAGLPPNGPHVRVVESHMNMPIGMNSASNTESFYHFNSERHLVHPTPLVLPIALLFEERSIDLLAAPPIDLEDLYFVDEN